MTARGQQEGKEGGSMKKDQGDKEVLGTYT